MKSWVGSKLGINTWQVYTDALRNSPIRITHNLGILESQQVFNVKFRNLDTGKEEFTGISYFFDGDVGPKFYVTEFSLDSFVIELRPRLIDGHYEYLIELTEEEVDQSITVTIGGSVDSQGFSVSYRFNFGDNTVTPWSSETTVSHIYEEPGIYQIRAQATAPGLDSYWSAPLTVKVLDEYIVVPTPSILEGDAKVQFGLMSSYRMSGTPILDGVMEYRVDWDDGTVSDWTPYNIFSHTWKDEGSYNIKVQGRTASGYQKLSEWSLPYTVEVKSAYYFIQEVESSQFIIDSTDKKSGTPTGSSLVVKNVATTFTVPRPFSLPEDVIQYKISYGNGIISEYQDSNVFNYSYAYDGTYSVTARVRKSVVINYVTQWEDYEWSDAFPVLVKTRVVSTPSIPYPDLGISEVKSREKGIITTNPAGELFLVRFGKKWISDYIPCEGLGKFLIQHGLSESPYLVYVDFELEGDSNVRAVEKRFTVKTDGLLMDFTSAIKQQIGGKIPITIHRYIESIILDSLGVEQKVITSRFRITTRS
jgi:hypothetical protein